jgi:tetratricopeptide (TPR) repeat protein
VYHGGVIRRRCAGFVILGWLAAGGAARAQGFPPTQPWSDVAIMPSVAAALGVACEYCHPPNGAPPPAAGEKSKREIAREMMTMVDELNARIPAATGKPAADLTRIQCVTCHRGVSVPGQLSEILSRTAIQKGADAAVTQYRDLRARYYGRQSYDFGEDELIRASQRLGNRPDAGLALAQINLEFYPKSARTYLTMAQLNRRKLDDDAAIECLEKALQLDPDNSSARGQLEQLKRYRRK